MWLIYALGGGWGHLTRAIALGRIAARERPVRILTNSPYASIAWPAFRRLTGGTACPTMGGEASVAQSVACRQLALGGNALELVALDARATAEQTRAAVTREIAESRPQCLIVDTFPRGIGGELAGVLGSLSARKVLVHRDLNPRYVEAASLRDFVAAHYDMVLVPGADEQWDRPPGLSRQARRPVPQHVTDPWLVRGAGEMPDRGQVKELLLLGPDEERCVLVCASGKEEELAWYGAVVAELIERSVPVRCVSAECPPRCPDECWVQYWPAMDLFGCAAVVVGGAGYNITQECLACGIPLITRPWPRLYDRQELRAQRASARGRVIVVQEAEEAARAALMRIDGPAGMPTTFVNGAVEAAERIEQIAPKVQRG